MLKFRGREFRVPGQTKGDAVMNILIGGAWPYANGSLHIGHLAALLPGDVLARYHRAKGDTVYYVSGSDCHGTPVAIRAQQEGLTPAEISERYHREFTEAFEKLGFSYDRYGKTSSAEHRDFVTAFHHALYAGGYVYEKSAPQAWCPSCGRFLPDRFVVGVCPRCGADARGDQCDVCGSVLEPELLQKPACSVCGAQPQFRPSTHLYLAVSRLERELTAYLASHPGWRKNALGLSKRYIDEGLRDRALTRDLDWGIDVPKPGYEGKKIYIWAENVLGYLSMSREVARQRGGSFEELWGENARHYYVHGKDNVPFHTIILPSLLLASGRRWHLPDEIVSSEYMTLEGRKISTSRNWAVWVKDIAARYDPDTIRYYFLANGPEKRDTDFSWREFIRAHNAELLGAFGNLINRTLLFAEKYCGGRVPEGESDDEVRSRIEGAFAQTGALIEAGELKNALDGVFDLVRFANRYFDAQRPWATRDSAPGTCARTIFNCFQLLSALSVLLKPFLPFSCAKLQRLLGTCDRFAFQLVPAGRAFPHPEVLFTRLDPALADEETARLHARAKDQR